MSSMMHNLFGGGGSNLPGFLGNIANVVRLFKQFIQNPLGALMSVGANVPQNVSGNAESMVNYLRNSGQMNEDQFNQLNQLANDVRPFLSKKF